RGGLWSPSILPCLRGGVGSARLLGHGKAWKSRAFSDGSTIPSWVLGALRPSLESISRPGFSLCSRDIAKRLVPAVQLQTRTKLIGCVSIPGGLGQFQRPLLRCNRLGESALGGVRRRQRIQHP